MKNNVTVNNPNTDIDRSHRIKHGIIAGFIASAISSLALVIITSLAVIPEFNYVAIQGSIFGIAGTALSAWIVYFLIGTFIWGILYAYTAHRIPGTNPFTKGLAFGLLIWLIVMIILMPLAGVGPFIRDYGIGAAAIVLIVDLIFGITLAYFYRHLTA